MPKPKPQPEAVEPEGAKAPAADPLASESGRAWLSAELARAEHEEAHGPAGAGWAYNESRRAGIVERAEFLRALVALLPK